MYLNLGGGGSVGRLWDEPESEGQTSDDDRKVKKKKEKMVIGLIPCITVHFVSMLTFQLSHIVRGGGSV